MPFIKSLCGRISLQLVDENEIQGRRLKRKHARHVLNPPNKQGSLSLFIKIEQTMYFLAILAVFIAGWGFCQYSILYPQSPWSTWQIVGALSLAYYQMYGELQTENVIRSWPFDMPHPEDKEWCTTDVDLYSNYTQIRCPNSRTNWLVFIFLMFFLLLTNLLLFNLLIAIFSNTFQKIEGFSYIFLQELLNLLLHYSFQTSVISTLSPS